MAKLTLEELKKKYNEKIVDNDDLVIELMEDLTDSFEVSKDIVDKYHELEKLSKTIIFIAKDSNVKGILSLSDKIKSNSKTTIEELVKKAIEYLS